jgi:uncharacterized membrane protein
MHLFAVVVWFGGLMYQAAVLHPVAKAEQKEIDPTTLHFLKRFQPFVWMSVWTLCITGIALMLFNPRFLFLHFDDRWSALLALKQIVFLLMVFFSFGYARMFQQVHERAQMGSDGEAVAYFLQMVVFGKVNVALAICALMLAAGMNS